MPVRPLNLPDELDAAWIVALWSAIQAGHPTPEVVAARAVFALSERIPHALTFEVLKAQFERLGVTVTEHAKAAASGKERRMDDGEAREFHFHQYCFKIESSTHCTELPVLTHLRTAA